MIAVALAATIFAIAYIRPNRAADRMCVTAQQAMEQQFAQDRAVCRGNTNCMNMRLQYRLAAEQQERARMAAIAAAWGQMASAPTPAMRAPVQCQWVGNIWQCM